MKRHLSLFIALLMVVTIPLTGLVRAEDTAVPAPICAHTHDEACGYTEGEDGEVLAECAHVCSEECLPAEEEEENPEPGPVEGEDAKEQGDALIGAQSRVDSDQKVHRIGTTYYTRNKDYLVTPANSQACTNSAEIYFPLYIYCDSSSADYDNLNATAVTLADAVEDITIHLSGFDLDTQVKIEAKLIYAEYKINEYAYFLRVKCLDMSAVEGLNVNGKITLNKTTGRSEYQFSNISLDINNLLFAYPLVGNDLIVGNNTMVFDPSALGLAGQQTLTLTDASGQASAAAFKIDVTGQPALLVAFNLRYNSLIASLYPAAIMVFYNGNGARFEQSGELFIPDDSGDSRGYLYRPAPGFPSEIEVVPANEYTYDQIRKGFVITTDTLGCYVVSDRALGSYTPDLGQKVTTLGNTFYRENADGKLVPYVAGSFIACGESIFIPILRANGELVNSYDAVRGAIKGYEEPYYFFSATGEEIDPATGAVFKSIDAPAPVDVGAASAPVAVGDASAAGPGSGPDESNDPNGFAYRTIAATNKSGYFVHVSSDNGYYAPNNFETMHIQDTIYISKDIGSQFDFAPISIYLDVIFGYPEAQFSIPVTRAPINTAALTGLYKMALDVDAHSFLFGDLNGINSLDITVDTQTHGFVSPISEANIVYCNVTVGGTFNTDFSLYVNIGEYDTHDFYVYTLDAQNTLTDFGPGTTMIWDETYLILPASQTVRYIISDCFLYSSDQYSSERVAYVGYSNDDQYLADAQGIVRRAFADSHGTLLPGTTVYIPLLREGFSSGGGIHSKLPVTKPAAVQGHSITVNYILGSSNFESFKIVEMSSDLFVASGTSKSYFLAVTSKTNNTTSYYDLEADVRISKTTGQDNEGSLGFSATGRASLTIGYPYMVGFEITPDKQIGNFANEVGNRTFSFTKFPDSSFKVDITGQTKLLLAADNSVVTAVKNSYPGAKLTFFNGNGAQFSKSGELKLAVNNGPYIYARSGNSLSKVTASYNSATKTFTIKTRSIGSYVISDTQLISESTGGSTRSSGGGGGGGGGTRTAVVAGPTAAPLTQAGIDATYNTAVAAAAADGRSELHLYFKNISEVTPAMAATLNQKAAGRSPTYCFDSYLPSGAVGIRLYLKPENITAGVSVDGTLESAGINTVVAHFSRWFKNDFKAFYTGSGSYNGNVRAAVYMDLSAWDTNNLSLYYYNITTNAYIPVPVQAVTYANKYLYLTLDHGDYIVVSQGPLTRK